MPAPPLTVPTLLITGTVGVGKSAVAEEISAVLADLEVPNAAVDLDALVCQWPPTSEWNNDLMFENLASLWPNYLAHGATRLILARVLEDQGELARYRAAVPGAEITVCRLVAPEAVRVRRLLNRMPPGPSRDWHLERTVELESILGQLGYEECTVENGDRPLRDVALEVLVRAGWVPEEAGPARRAGPGLPGWLE